MEKSIAIAIMQIYPQLQPGIDFMITEDEGVQTIAVWNSTETQPTQEELDAAWNNYVANPPVKPLTDIEQLQKNQADLTYQLMIQGVV